MESGMRAAWCLVLAGAAAVLAEDPPVSKGFEYFYNLQYDESIAEFSRQVAEQPNEPSGYNHLAQAILYRDMFRAGALESELVSGTNPFLRRSKVDASPEDQRRFDQAIGRAMGLAQASLKRNPNDTQALYALGVSYGLRANYNFLVRKAWRDSLRDATSARRCHSRATEIDPGLIDAQLVQGLHDYIVGSLPVYWRFVGFLIGFRGNKDEGIRRLELVAEKGRVNRIDAQILLCAVCRRERRPQRAVVLLEGLIRRFPGNYLLPMELAQMYSDLGDKEKALAPLRQLEQQKRSGASGYAQLKMEKICYAEGTIQFWYNDLDAALANMKQATAAAEELDLNTGVLGWLRLGQIYDLKGQRGLAIEAYRHAMAFAPDSDAARESRQYLVSPYRRKQRG
jgi:tetratricopeptide (TPR) repeat protein